MRSRASGDAAYSSIRWSNVCFDVERHRVEPSLASPAEIDLVRFVADLREPERVREPARGVDREHARPAAATGGSERDRGARGRLPDPAGAADDDDLPIGDDPVEVHAISSRAGHEAGGQLSDGVPVDGRDEQERQLEERDVDCGAEASELRRLLAAAHDL